MGLQDEQRDPSPGAATRPVVTHAEIVKLTEDMSRFVREEERWVRRVWAPPIGGLLGLAAGIVVTSLLALAKFMNPISTLGILLVLTFAGTIIANLRGPRSATTRSLALQRAHLRMLRESRDDLRRAHERYLEDLARLAEGDSPRDHPAATQQRLPPGTPRGA